LKVITFGEGRNGPQEQTVQFIDKTNINNKNSSQEYFETTFLSHINSIIIRPKEIMPQAIIIVAVAGDLHSGHTP